MTMGNGLLTVKKLLMTCMQKRNCQNRLSSAMASLAARLSSLGTPCPASPLARLLRTALADHANAANRSILHMNL
ncbi:hypothetical protein EVAR_64528_1 [Eumeta japonica]|uniref:Uncharacterized protein n=1 Tax=Eumeta variegata TaxID=151549 RepID=A0A4C1ZDA9_EUMVA|nr:hypothetical protein EVAR_64528_1 [Eumeta japonica]